MSDKEAEDNLMVTVIGGGGFLGQHLIKLLHTYETRIEFIRILDFMPFVQELEYTPSFTIHSIIGSVTSIEDLITATKGATTVFHLASVTDRSMFPDYHVSELVNVTGTKNVIRACRENGVKNLIYASDVAVVMGYTSIVKGTEVNTNYPRPHLFHDGRSKSQAERLVLEASSNNDSKDGKLQTVSLRLVTLYGELDSFRWPRLVQMAALNHGHLPCVGKMKSKLQMMYVGNAAWALICAHDALSKVSSRSATYTNTNDSQESESFHECLGGNSDQTLRNRNSEKSKASTKCDSPDQKLNKSQSELNTDSSNAPVVAGRAYFVGDQSLLINYFQFMQPLLQRYGFFLTSWTLPEGLAKVIMWLMHAAFWLLYPFFRTNPPFSKQDVHELCHTYTFNDSLAQEVLKYKPIFEFKESLQRTKTFYDGKYKEAMSGCMLARMLGSKHVGNVRRMSKFKRDIKGLNLGDNGKRFRPKTATGDKWLL